MRDDAIRARIISFDGTAHLVEVNLLANDETLLLGEEEEKQCRNMKREHGYTDTYVRGRATSSILQICFLYL